MKIAVCLKQVPSTTAVIRVAEDGAGLDLSGVEMVLNPYDEIALEEALRSREKLSGSELLALTVGGEESAKVLTLAFALGADEAVRIHAPEADARAAARAAAALLKPLAPGLVFCGRQAIDDDLWLFPATLAEALGMPHVTALSRFELSEDGTKASCRRPVEGGEEVIELALPAVVSCNKGLNEPRVPTLRGRLNAKKKKPGVKTPAELGLADAALAPAFTIGRYEPPPEKQPGKLIQAPPAEAAAELVRLLREEAKVV